MIFSDHTDRHACIQHFGNATVLLPTILAALVVVMNLSVMAAAPSIGFNFSDARTETKMAGKTADGCTNWFDSFPAATGGYVDHGYADLAYGTITFAGGIITAQWNSATTWSGGSFDDSQQQLYMTYLDDGDDGNLVASDGIGASVTLSGLSSWLAANQATRYQIRIYHSSDNSGITSNTTASIRLGAPNPANGFTQLTALPILETVSLPWLGDGGFPTVVSGGNGSRGYGDSSTNLSADVITITLPSRAATGFTSRGSLTAIRLTPLDSASAPAAPLPAYGQAVTNNAPLAYWRLNELTGATIAADFFDNNNGTIGSNVTAGVSGPQNPSVTGFETNNLAVSLNGTTNSYLTMPTLNLNTNTVTITGWINPTGIQAAAAGIAFCRGGTTAAGLGFPSGGGNELRYTWNGLRSNISTGLIVPTNQWSFFALVVSPTGATLYLGTNLVLNSFTDSVSLPAQAFDAPLRIGFDPGASNRLFNGRIDEVAIYKRALTLGQVQNLYIAAAGCLGNPSVTVNPTNQTVFSGVTGTFSVAGTGATVLSYQWQLSTNSGASFANIAGATNASYTTLATILPNNGNQYRAVVSGLCGTPATSTAATLSVFPPPLADYARAVTNSLPLAYWQLNEPSGTVAFEFYGTYNGTIGSAVTPGVSGPQNPPFAGFESNNSAMQLNYIANSLLTMPTFNLNTNTVTITGWMNPNGSQADAAGLIFCRGGSTTAGLNFPPGGGNQLRYTWNGVRYDVATGLVVPTNQWCFFALVVTPTGATIYLGTNGVLNSFTDSVSLPSQAFDAPLLIGFDPSSGGRLFKGVIDEVVLYNRSLTPTQIQQLYIGGTGCPGAPSITNQPANQAVLGGSTATFSVSAAGPTLLSYQWQVSTNGGSSFSNVSGATNTTYMTATTTPPDNGKQYRVVVSGLCGAPATSTAATLSVEFGSYPAVATNNSPVAYWRLNEPNGATVAADFFGVNNGTIGAGITGGVSGPQNPPFAGFETQNTAMQLNFAANSILTMPALNLNTNRVTITGWINPTGVQADAAGLIFCRGGTTTAGLNFPSGGGNELRYTWNGARFDVSTGLIVPTNQWSFFALVVSPIGATLYLGTNGVLNSFTDSVSLPNQAFDTSLLIGFDPSSGGRLFKGKIDEVAIYKQSLTLAQVQQLYVTGAGCPGNPTVTNSPANQTVFAGATAAFTVAATGPTVLSYQWQVSTNGGSSFGNVTGATNTSYTTPVTTLADNGTQYRAVVAGLCGTPATSAAATLSVNPPPTVVLGSYGQAISNSLPIAYWRLNETNGATAAVDFFGVYNGAIGADVVPGLSGPQDPPFSGFASNNAAMQFNGAANSFLTMPTLNLNTNILTIIGWMNPTGVQADWAGVVFSRGGTTVAGLNFNDATTTGTNELRYTWNALGFNTQTGLKVPTNQWSFFALVVKPTGATVYLGTNGILNSFTDSVSLPMQAFDSPLLIGSDSFSTRRFKGRLDEVAIYDRALTPLEIQQFYITGAGCPGNPTVTTQPSSQTVLSGLTATFSVVATGPTQLNYQWQISTNAGSSFGNLAGATNTSYTTPSLTLANDGGQYRVIVTGLCGTPATSAAATLSVSSPASPLSSYGQAVTNSVPVAYWRLNETNAATVAADFFGVYHGIIGPGVTAGVSGPQNPPFVGLETNNTAMQFSYATNSILTMPALNVNTNTVTITGWINPTGIQADWAGVVFCRGASTAAGLNFSGGGINDELRYTWNGVRFDVSTGLIVPTNQWSFFALVVSPAGATVYLGTNGVLNSFTDSLGLTSQAFDAPLLIGYDPGTASRLFKGKIDEVAIYSRALSLTQIHQLYITGAGCPGSPTITNQPASQSVSSGSTAMFTVVATGPTSLSYQWQISTNSGASFDNLAGATNTSYTTAATILSDDGRQYRVVVTGFCGTPAISAAATLSVGLSSPGSYPNVVSNSAPVAYWRLNEPNGASVTVDFFGVYNGAIGADVVAGLSGPQDPPFSGFASNNAAMQFNGAANSLLTMPTLNLNTNTVTIIGWMNPTGVQADWAGVVFSRGGTTIAGLNFNDATATGTNELRYTWNGVRFNTQTGLKVPTNQWSFFALVVTPTGATVYLGTNGVLNSFTDSVGLPMQAFDSPLLIGSDSFSTRRFKGRLDEVATYNRALTLTQVYQLYISGNGCPGGPSVTSQPASQTVLSGSTAAFVVAASGPTPWSYQWLISTNGGASFANLSGATNTSYTTAATILSDDGTQYRVIVTGLCGTPATSDVATLSVNSSSLGSYPQIVTNNAPVAYWRLNEANGATVAADFFGTYNGSIGAGITGGVSGPQDPPFAGFETNNTAMQLNYASDSILTMPALNLNTNRVTIIGWINPTGIQADAAGLIFCRGGTTTAGLNFPPGGGNELRYTWDGARYDVATGLVVPTNQWSFFALVLTPTGATIYLGTNGVLRSFTDSVNLPAQAFDASLLIGLDPSSGVRLFNGRIDEIAIYKQSLTTTQIQQLYITGAGCPGNPVVTNQPASQALLSGSTATFTVGAAGPTLLSYQWQISTNGGSTFADISGATSASYTTPSTTLADNGKKYRAVITGLCGTPVTSAVATLSVEFGTYAQVVTNQAPFAYWRMNEANGATVAADFFGVHNGTIGAGVTGGVSGPQDPPFTGFETNNTAMQLNYASDSILTMPALNLNTNTVTITGWINPTGIQGDAAGLAFCRGGTTVAGVNFASGGINELRYTWNGLRFDVSTGLVVPTNQWSFFALVITPTSSKIYLGTNGVLNSFTDSTSLPNQAFDSPLLIGSDPSSGTRLFKGRVDEVAVFNRALTPTQIQQLYITGASCPGGPSVNTPPSNQSVLSGSTATFSVAATGPTLLNYQWQISTNGGGNFTDISGANSASYTTPASALGDNGTQYRVIVSGICGSPVTSDAAILSVELGGYSQTVISNTPLAYWRLNETNGASVAVDSVGANNGTINSGVLAGVSGPQSPAFPGFETINTAAQLNGTGNSYLTMPTFNLNTNAVTITGWINPTGIQVDWAAIVFCRSATTAAGLNFNDATAAGYNELRYTWNGGRYDTQTGLRMPINQWSFFALVVTPTNATIYLGTNGVLNSFTDNLPQTNQLFDAPLLIGRDAFFGRAFNGRIDEVAIYNHAVMPAQIEQLFANTGYVPPPPPPLTPFEMWQLQHFGCTNCSEAAASANPDGDNLSNEQEFLAGTDPTNAVSTLAIAAIDQLGSDIRITWTSEGGHGYAVQTNSSPGGGFVDLSPLISVPSNAGESTTNYLHVGGATNAPVQYYRVRLVP